MLTKEEFTTMLDDIISDESNNLDHDRSTNYTGTSDTKFRINSDSYNYGSESGYCNAVLAGSGGMSGGSCWGTNAEPYYECNYNDYLDAVRKAIIRRIITEIFDTNDVYIITHLQNSYYEDSYTSTEYYGNENNYSVVYFDFDELYNYYVSVN